MVDFLHYGIKKHSTKPVATKTIIKKFNKIEQAPVKEEKVEGKKEEEMTAQVIMAESTAQVLEDEKIEIKEADTVEEVVEKVNKSKKVRAKKEKNGNVRVKQVLQD